MRSFDKVAFYIPKFIDTHSIIWRCIMSKVTQFKKGSPSKGSFIQINRSQNPFLSLQNEVDRLFRDFNEFLPTSKFNLGQFEKLDLSPSMDVVEDKEHFCVQLEMPGMDEKDVKVSIADNVLTIRGEKSSAKKMKVKNLFLEKLAMENMNVLFLYLQPLISLKQKQHLKKECFGLIYLKNRIQIRCAINKS